jgi:hypothetical protein
VAVVDERAVAEGAGVRLLTTGMSRMLLVASGLVFVVGVQLFVLTEHTDRCFAWTVEPPITAAFLGANYWASFTLEWFASRERVWVRARTAVPSVLLFTSLTEIATLLNIRFYDTTLFRGPVFYPRALAVWTWIVVYLSVPVIMGTLLYRQGRAPGHNPARERRLPRPLRATFALHAAMMLVLGAGLMFSARWATSLWPWSLQVGDPTYVSANDWYVGVWLVGIGVIAGQVAFEDDLRRARYPMLSYFVLGILQSIALARYPRSLDWSTPRSWVYLGVVVSIAVAGGIGWRAAERHARDPSPPTPGARAVTSAGDGAGP